MKHGDQIEENVRKLKESKNRWQKQNRRSKQIDKIETE